MVENPGSESRSSRRVGIRPAYTTPGSLTSWSVHFRRAHKTTAPVTTSEAAIKPSVLASNRRLRTVRR